MGAGNSMKDSKGRQLISQPAFAIAHDISVATGADFDGTANGATDFIYFDAAKTNQFLERGTKPRKIRSKFGSGFLFMPDTDGDQTVLTYDAYRENNCTIDDNYATELQSLPAGVWHETRVIKVYSTGSPSATINIGV